MRLPVIMTAVVALGLGACETMQAAKQERPVEFTVSDFCLNAEKQPWSIHNDKRSIDAARRLNEKIDRLCREKQVATS